jgi:hypothetical protein
LNSGNSTEKKAIEVGFVTHRPTCETDQNDYSDRDSFSNVKKQLHSNIEQNFYQYHRTQQQRPIQPVPKHQRLSSGHAKVQRLSGGM